MREITANYNGLFLDPKIWVDVTQHGQAANEQF
jgi:hypothetical protein